MTRLVTTDAFPPIARLRAEIEARYGDESAWTYLSQCGFCASVWLGALIVFAVDRLVDGGLPVPVLVWACASAAAGLISAWEPE